MSNPPIVAQLMTTDLVVCHPREAAARAASRMASSGIRHLPVVDEQGAVVGVVSQRDLVEVDPHARVEDVMSADVLTVAPETAASEAAYLLWRHKIGCVPVTAPDGKLVGLLTDSDFVRLAYALLGGRVAVNDLAAEEHEAERF